MTQAIQVPNHYDHLVACKHSWRYRPELWGRIKEAWLVLIGRNSLHLAWQVGHDDGIREEYQRCVVNKGR